MDTSAIRRRLSTLLLVFSFVASSLYLATPPAQAYDGPGVESDIVQFINRERVARGLQPVAVAPDITAVARRWSDTMAATNRLSHNPNFSRELCCWARVSENVGYTKPYDTQAAVRLHQGFMNSPGHRANVLNPQVNQVGVGVEIQNNTTWVAVNFRQRR
jgi:uncharacterized protein YkwD